MDWREEFESLIRCIGSATYGKERWFYDGKLWYDRYYCDYITTEELIYRIYKELREL